MLLSTHELIAQLLWVQPQFKLDVYWNQRDDKQADSSVGIFFSFMCCLSP